MFIEEIHQVTVGDRTEKTTPGTGLSHDHKLKILDLGGLFMSEGDLAFTKFLEVMETVLQFLGGTVACLQSFTLGNKIVAAVSVLNFYGISQGTKIRDIFSQYQPHFLSSGLYLLREAGEGVSYWGTYPAV
jgi:hypothetical protein